VVEDREEEKEKKRALTPLEKVVERRGEGRGRIKE
jgi:hypothetical protein